MSREIYIDAELEPRRPRPRPPLIGTPPPAVKDRPKCPACTKPLRPRMRTHCEQTPDGMLDLLHPTAREWTGSYDAYAQIFCGVTCAARYGVAVIRRARGQC